MFDHCPALNRFVGVASASTSPSLDDGTRNRVLQHPIRSNDQNLWMTLGEAA
jgi:hypothetical protein